MKEQTDEKCAFKTLFEKMEKLDREMRSVKETLLQLREHYTNSNDTAQLETDHNLFNTGEDTDDN